MSGTRVRQETSSETTVAVPGSDAGGLGQGNGREDRHRRPGQGCWEARGSAFGFGFPFTQSTRGSGPLDFPWPSWCSPQHAGDLTSFLPAPSLPCPGRQPFLSKDKGCPSYSVTVSPPPGLACGPRYPAAPVPASPSPCGCSLCSPTGQKLTRFPQIGFASEGGPRASTLRTDTSPGSVILEKDPKVASFLGKFSSDPAPAGVEQADVLSFLTRRLGRTDWQWLESCVERGSEAASGLPGRR